MPWGLAIGAAVELANAEFIQKPALQKQRDLASATAKYSPWTGMKPQNVASAPNYIGDAMQGAVAGAGVANSMSNTNAWNTFLTGKGLGGGTPGAPASANTGVGGAPGLGGQDMVNQLGAVAPPPTQAQLGEMVDAQTTASTPNPGVADEWNNSSGTWQQGAPPPQWWDADDPTKSPFYGNQSRYAVVG